MIAIRSQEVLVNRELHQQEPDLYRLALTDYVWCDCTCLCDHAIEVFAKHVSYTTWTCVRCLNQHEPVATAPVQVTVGRSLNKRRVYDVL